MDHIAIIYFCKIYRTDIVAVAKQCHTHFCNIGTCSALLWCSNRQECIKLKKLSTLIPTVKLYFGKEDKIICYLKNVLNRDVGYFYSLYCKCLKLCDDKIDKYSKSFITCRTKQFQGRHISTASALPALACSRGKITIFVCDNSQKAMILSQILAHNIDNCLCVYGSLASIRHGMIHARLYEKAAVCFLLCRKYFARLQFRYLKKRPLRRINRIVDVRYVDSLSPESH